MPFPSMGQSRIRTNIAAENAYNALSESDRDISLRQLRLSTGKRINNASDDVAGYITSRSLIMRNESLNASLELVGQAHNISNILMDSLSEISDLITEIKRNATAASSGAMGTDEKVAQAKAAYRMVQQIQTVVDSSVFGGRALLDSTYKSNFFIGLNAKNELITLTIDMTPKNDDFDLESNYFNVNAMSESNFAGITGLDLKKLYEVEPGNLGILDESNINSTLISLSKALQNTTKVAAYLGGISNRLYSQEDVLSNQITNYKSAISRIEDSDIAKEQLQLVKSQFLQQTSLISLTQANQIPGNYVNLIQQGM